MIFSSPHMATNVEVKKNNQESTANLIRRFTKRVQGSGVLNRLRKERYCAREKSPLVTCKQSQLRETTQARKDSRSSTRRKKIIETRKIPRTAGDFSCF